MLKSLGDGKEAQKSKHFLGEGRRRISVTAVDDGRKWNALDAVTSSRGCNVKPLIAGHVVHSTHSDD